MLSIKKKNSIEAWFQQSLASPAFISNLDKQGYGRFLKLIVVVGETRRPVWEVRSHEAYRREKETEDTQSLTAHTVLDNRDKTTRYG